MHLRSSKSIPDLQKNVSELQNIPALQKYVQCLKKVLQILKISKNVKNIQELQNTSQIFKKKRRETAIGHKNSAVLR